MKLGNVQSVLLFASSLFLAGSGSAHASDTAITGVVKDSSGMPQMDVLVQLIRADSSILQSVRTDARGRYLIAGVLPGVYQIKAVETSFLPTLRENLRVGTRGHTEVNLTLSTLLEALQWLPAQKRTSAEPEDEWTWTLRSAAYRPLLRFVGEDGIETIEGPHSPRDHHHGRVLIESGSQQFADAGPGVTAEYRRDAPDASQTLVRARTGASAESSTQLMAGYEQKNAMGAGLTSVVSYLADPSITSGLQSTLHVTRLRTADTLQLTPDLRAEVGNQVALMNLGASTSSFFSPFLNATWQHGNATLGYVLATTPGVENAESFSEASTLVPAVVMSVGKLSIEHGLHQAVRLEHSEDGLTESVAIYRDSIENPVAEAEGHVGPAALNDGTYLFDPRADRARIAGPGYDEQGVVVEVSRKGPGSSRASVQYATGNALVLSNAASSAVLTGPTFKAHPAQSVTLKLQGASERMGTSWRTSYRMQSGSTVNAVDLFDSGEADAYLSLFLRQSLHLGRIFPGGVDAVVDVRNLLAQGYHPFLTSDGSTLFFAQVNRSVRGGLAFYF